MILAPTHGLYAYYLNTLLLTTSFTTFFLLIYMQLIRYLQIALTTVK